MIQKLDSSPYKNYNIFNDSFKKVIDTLPFKEFLRDFVPLGTQFYLTEDKKSGFIIKPDKELACIFNANPDYKLLKDPEVISIIKENADFMVCIGYYRMKNKKGENVLVEHSLCDYYNKTLGFNCLGKTREDVTDFVESRGLEATVNFIQKYGVPYHNFMVNPKYDISNFEDNKDFGSFGYNWGMTETKAFIRSEKIRLGELPKPCKVLPHFIDPKFTLPKEII